MCSKLKTPLHIDIDSRYYIIGNDILSSTFIAHYLLHRYGLCYYKDDYILNIIDSNMNYLSLNKNQYICISTNDYTIEDL